MEAKLTNYDTLVLSGGGVKGFHILGATQALLDSQMLTDVKTYVGTSIGAIISYMLAIGYTPIEIVVSVHVNKWLERVQNFNLVAMINGNGATSFTSIYDSLEKMTLNKIGRLLTLKKLEEEFGKTLICTTYNMTTCNIEYLGPDNYPDLPCLTALRMSANIPLVFERFKYMDNFYVDGGLGDNFPISKGVEIGGKVIGVHLEISEQSLKDEPEDGLLAYFVRLLQVPIIQSTKFRSESVQDKSVIIPIRTPKLRNALKFDIDSKTRLEMFSNGYNCVKNFLEKESEFIVSNK